MCSIRRLIFHLSPSSRLCPWLAGWCLLCIGAGCNRRFLEHQPPPTLANIPGAAAVRLLGTVHVIGTGGRFVLVESSPATAVAANLTDGQTLVCRAAGSDTATLHVSHERRPPFVVADVASGEPHIGDEVFVVPKIAPAADPVPSPSVPSASPATTPPFRASPLLPPAS